MYLVKVSSIKRELCEISLDVICCPATIYIRKLNLPYYLKLIWIDIHAEDGQKAKRLKSKQKKKKMKSAVGSTFKTTASVFKKQKPSVKTADLTRR